MAKAQGASLLQTKFARKLLQRTSSLRGATHAPFLPQLSKLKEESESRNSGSLGYPVDVDAAVRALQLQGHEEEDSRATDDPLVSLSTVIVVGEGNDDGDSEGKSDGSGDCDADAECDEQRSLHLVLSRGTGDDIAWAKNTRMSISEV